jgi:hypothetical protein
LTPDIIFHTIVIDFILALPVAPDGDDCLLTFTCKASKTKLLIPGKTTWTAERWGKALLAKLLENNWGVPCKTISDRDKKFVSDLWRAMYKELKVDLLYSTAHHPQTDGQRKELIKQSRSGFAISSSTFPIRGNGKKLLLFLTHVLNSAPTQPSGYSPHQLMYGQKLNDPTSLMNPHLTAQDFDLRTDARESLRLAAMDMKRAYDKKHTWTAYAPGDQVLIRLHDGYTIPADRSNKPDQNRLGTKF